MAGTTRVQTPTPPAVQGRSVLVRVQTPTPANLQQRSAGGGSLVFVPTGLGGTL
jgi:hypothetical protein